MIIVHTIGVRKLTNQFERLLSGFELFGSKMLHRQIIF